jgi:hypothetical protein
MEKFLIPQDENGLRCYASLYGAMLIGLITVCTYSPSLTKNLLNVVYSGKPWIK